MQHDYLLPNLTVRETLTFAGLLSLPASLSKADKLAMVRFPGLILNDYNISHKFQVEDILLELGLKDCADNLVGVAGSYGISGGERRRVSIGVQLLTDPSTIISSSMSIYLTLITTI